MTSIWTPSRELWTPRKPSLLRKVTDWVRMATAGQTLLNSSGQTAMNSSGQELVYDTGGCGCCGPGGCSIYPPAVYFTGGASGTQTFDVTNGSPNAALTITSSCTWTVVNGGGDSGTVTLNASGIGSFTIGTLSSAPSSGCCTVSVSGCGSVQVCISGSCPFAIGTPSSVYVNPAAMPPAPADQGFTPETVSASCQPACTDPSRDGNVCGTSTYGTVRNAYMGLPSEAISFGSGGYYVGSTVSGGSYFYCPSGSPPCPAGAWGSAVPNYSYVARTYLLGCQINNGIWSWMLEGGHFANDACGGCMNGATEGIWQGYAPMTSGSPVGAQFQLTPVAAGNPATCLSDLSVVIT